RDEEVRASHILIRGTGSDSLQKAQEMRRNIGSVEAFIKASESCSECPSNAKCGDLGFFSRGTMLREIEEVAFTMEVNQISEAFLTRYGYHILMLTDRRPHGVIPFQEIKETLRARLIHMEKEYCLTRHLAYLRQKHSQYIQIFDYSLSHYSDSG
ncbi:MAG: peptidylprolyl isomerase, partial [Candidatus Cloacimonadaceae bacterium]|nr:peptidylprolyl isomerase [Candidatus Cloacimonadaceae bacterium]